jgi:hypothetical protein
MALFSGSNIKLKFRGNAGFYAAAPYPVAAFRDKHGLHARDIGEYDATISVQLRR